MAASIYDVLRAQVTTAVVSQIAASTSRFLIRFGMQTGGPSERIVGHREFGYDVFNNTRVAGTTSAPGAPANRITRQAVGRVTGTFPRMAESMFLPYEQIHNLRRIGGPASEFDEAGRDYITRQERYLAQRVANWRTTLLVGMLQGALYMHQSGRDFFIDYTATPTYNSVSYPSIGQIDYKMPAANLTQLNMNGTGNILTSTWLNTAANIPLMLENVDQAFMQQCGQRLELVIMSGPNWQACIMPNDFVAAGAGIANTPYETYNRVAGIGPDGTPITEKVGVIRACPWVEFLLTNEGTLIGPPGSEVWTPHVSSTQAYFLPQPRPEIFEMQVGSEVVIEYENGPATVRAGLWTWTKTADNPAGYEMFAIDNAVPAIYVPNALACGTIIF